MKKAVFTVFVLVFTFFAVHSFGDTAPAATTAQATQPAAGRAALVQQLKDVETQIEAVKADLKNSTSRRIHCMTRLRL